MVALYLTPEPGHCAGLLTAHTALSFTLRTSLHHGALLFFTQLSTQGHLFPRPCCSELREDQCDGSVGKGICPQA